jgi:hypothetical protein
LNFEGPLKCAQSQNEMRSSLKLPPTPLPPRMMQLEMSLLMLQC